MNNYDLLISKLDAFIRKYYANKLIKGILVFLTCLLLFILTVSISEYYFYLPSWLRVFIASVFVLGGLAALGIWVVVPLTKMAKLGKVISHEQAATIIGVHFSNVSDKLLNILQLKKNNDSSASKELIEASIDQKAKQLVPVPVASAIDLSKNKRYLPYLLPVMLIGVFILIAAPSVFTDASERLLQPTKTFEKPAPFQFILSNQEFKAIRGSDFTLKAHTEGDVVPTDLSVAIDGDIIPMNAVEQQRFEYIFRNMTTPVIFRLYAAGFYSRPYTIEVIQKPILKSFKVALDYPDYTGRKDEQVNNLSDMTVPAGTRVKWILNTEHTDKLAFRYGNEGLNYLPKSNNAFTTESRFLRDTSYTIMLSNSHTGATDSLTYFVKVTPDEHPVLQLQEFRDSVSGTQILLSGTAGDDYGIQRVLFKYIVTNAQNQELAKKEKTLDITRGVLTNFEYYFDVQDLKLQPGQKVSYYVEAWDNDAVFGSKATRSELMSYQMFDAKQLDSAINANAEQINSGLSNSSQRAEQLQEQYKDMESKLLKSNSMDWEQQQSLQNMMKMQQSLQNEMKAVKKRFDEQKQQSQQKEYSQDLKDKQEELEKQMDNLVDKELQEQMKKLQELMSKLNKEQAVETMQKLQEENKLFSMDMERMKQLMNKLEMQMRLEDLAAQMSELAKKEMELKEKTDSKSESAEQLAKEQEELKKELEKAMNKEGKEAEELNKKLSTPQDMDNDKKLAKEAKEQMDKASQQLKGQQNSKASESESKAAENLQDMANSFMSMASGMNSDQLKKDIRMVRQVLSNLMRLSFDQEQLMDDIRETNVASQQYVAKQQEQSRLHENSKMIRDSLFSLSKDMFKLQATVNKETTELENNMRKTLRAIENRSIGEAMTRQQYVMTHTNNLALMLNEMLSNLLSMQSQSQQGKAGQCENPGGATPKQGKSGMSQQLSDVITKQKELGNAMQQMENALQKRKGGSSKGEDGKPASGGQQGQPGESNEYGDAEKLARMAQQQAAIRRKIQELASMLNSKSMGEQAKELRELQEEMDKNETQLVNKRLGSELLLRQKEILTRLLEAEKSIREQQQDDKRSSKSAKETSRPIPAELKEKLKEQKELTEQYKTTPGTLKPYYKSIVERYYQQLGT